MDPQADSEAEFIVVSTPDCTESAQYSAAALPQVGGFTRNAKLFVNSFRSLPSFLGGTRVTEPQTSEAGRTYTRKHSETIGMQAVDRLVTNYNYYISGGVGGSGGGARDHGTGGGGGTGHGPTVYIGETSRETLSPFRTIHLGDLDLVKEIRLSERSSVVHRPSREAGVRRMYQANLVIRESDRKVTVAMYQGKGAEEEWRRDRTAYESIRHPNILQLYGLVTTTNLCAMVFHDELIPYTQFWRRFEHSPILTTYIMGYCSTEWWEAVVYHSSVYPRAQPERLFYHELPLWIRPATGQLCIDLGPGQERDMNVLLDTTPRAQDSILRILRLENISLDDPNAEALVITSLDKNKYHELCSTDPTARYRWLSIPSRLPIPCWPTLSQLDSNRRALRMLTKPLDFHPEVELAWDTDRVREYKVFPNAWTRYDARQAYNLDLYLSVHTLDRDSLKFWLAQAVHIFSQLQTTSDNFNDYILLTKVTFRLQCLPNPSNSLKPDGYLFVCPPEDFRTGKNSLKWSDCPAYWSLDPSGTVRLSLEDAKSLGFPIIHIGTVSSGYSWDERVYQGLRKFHAGKGFDPNSQEVAKHAGYPLFELSTEDVPPLEYVEERLWCDLERPARCQALGHYL
ncbi:hypothetical protein MSAN_02272400 [Mycena sanguinolenta]|uniref:Protein kinase domain-containing protein n=1 Tax=Mycena sanguinolenta TaxID=230812 RepID=A0A8H6XAW8_9AGAR|nr:hypothetical protein MSAN_02272400 [Mycena sanguinolenta]